MPKSDGSLHGLIAEYLASPEYEKLATSSKEQYRRALDAARERFVFVNISDLGEDRMVQEIFDWRDAMRNTPTKSNSYISVLKAVSLGTEEAQNQIQPSAVCRIAENHWAEGQDLDPAATRRIL